MCIHDVFNTKNTTSLGTLCIKLNICLCIKTYYFIDLKLWIVTKTFKLKYERIYIEYLKKKSIRRISDLIFCWIALLVVAVLALKNIKRKFLFKTLTLNVYFRVVSEIFTTITILKLVWIQLKPDPIWWPSKSFFVRVRYISYFEK